MYYFSTFYGGMNIICIILYLIYLFIKIVVSLCFSTGGCHTIGQSNSSNSSSINISSLLLIVSAFFNSLSQVSALFFFFFFFFLVSPSPVDEPKQYRRTRRWNATRNWSGRLLNFDVFGTNISIDDARIARNSSRVRRVLPPPPATSSSPVIARIRKIKRGRNENHTQQSSRRVAITARRK